MSLQTAQLIIEWLRNILLLAAAFLGFKAARSLFEMRSKDKMMAVKKAVFLLLALAVAFISLGFISENISGIVSHDFSFVGAISFSLAYLCCIIAFSYFWQGSSRLHKLHISEPLFFTAVVAAVMLWQYYLLRLSIGLVLTTPSFINHMIFFAHPLAVSLIFMLTLIIHPAHQAKVVRTPLWYLSGGVFFYFLAYNMMSYSFVQPVGKVLPFAYNILFLISAAYFAIGFYAAGRKYKPQEQKPDSGKASD